MVNNRTASTSESELVTSKTITMARQRKIKLFKLYKFIAATYREIRKHLPNLEMRNGNDAVIIECINNYKRCFLEIYEKEDALEYFEVCGELAQNISRTLDLFKEIINANTNMDEYYHRVCELLSIFIACELRLSVDSKDDDNDLSDISSRIIFIIKRHLTQEDEEATRYNILLTLVYIPRLFNAREIVCRIFEEFFPLKRFTEPTALPDKLYILYIILYYRWMSMKSQEDDKKSIVIMAEMFMKPMITLCNNQIYVPYLPPYTTHRTATRTILCNLKTYQDLRTASIIDNSYKKSGAIVNLCDDDDVIVIPEPEYTLSFSEIFAAVQLEPSKTSKCRIKHETNTIIDSVDLTVDESESESRDNEILLKYENWLHNYQMMAKQLRESQKVLEHQKSKKNSEKIICLDSDNESNGPLSESEVEVEKEDKREKNTEKEKVQEVTISGPKSPTKKDNVPNKSKDKTICDNQNTNEDLFADIYPETVTPIQSSNELEDEEEVSKLVRQVAPRTVLRTYETKKTGCLKTQMQKNFCSSEDLRKERTSKSFHQEKQIRFNTSPLGPTPAYSKQSETFTHPLKRTVDFPHTREFDSFSSRSSNLSISSNKQKDHFSAASTLFRNIFDRSRNHRLNSLSNSNFNNFPITETTFPSFAANRSAVSSSSHLLLSSPTKDLYDVQHKKRNKIQNLMRRRATLSCRSDFDDYMAALEASQNCETSTNIFSEGPGIFHLNKSPNDVCSDVSNETNTTTKYHNRIPDPESQNQTDYYISNRYQFQDEKLMKTCSVVIEPTPEILEYERKRDAMYNELLQKQRRKMELRAIEKMKEKERRRQEKEMKRDKFLKEQKETMEKLEKMKITYLKDLNNEQKWKQLKNSPTFNNVKMSEDKEVKNLFVTPKIVNTKNWDVFSSEIESSEAEINSPKKTLENNLSETEPQQKLKRSPRRRRTTVQCFLSENSNLPKPSTRTRKKLVDLENNSSNLDDSENDSQPLALRCTAKRETKKKSTVTNNKKQTEPEIEAADKQTTEVIEIDKNSPKKSAIAKAKPKARKRKQNENKKSNNKEPPEVEINESQKNSESLENSSQLSEHTIVASIAEKLSSSEGIVNDKALANADKEEILDTIEDILQKETGMPNISTPHLPPPPDLEVIENIVINEIQREMDANHNRQGNNLADHHNFGNQLESDMEKGKSLESNEVETMASKTTDSSTLPLLIKSVESISNATFEETTKTKSIRQTSVVITENILLNNGNGFLESSSRTMPSTLLSDVETSIIQAELSNISPTNINIVIPEVSENPLLDHNEERRNINPLANGNGGPLENGSSKSSPHREEDILMGSPPYEPLRVTSDDDTDRQSIANEALESNKPMKRKENVEELTEPLRQFSSQDDENNKSQINRNPVKGNLGIKFKTKLPINQFNDTMEERESLETMSTLDEDLMTPVPSPIPDQEDSIIQYEGNSNNNNFEREEQLRNYPMEDYPTIIVESYDDGPEPLPPILKSPSSSNRKSHSKTVSFNPLAELIDISPITQSRSIYERDETPPPEDFYRQDHDYHGIQKPNPLPKPQTKPLKFVTPATRKQFDDDRISNISEDYNSSPSSSPEPENNNLINITSGSSKSNENLERRNNVHLQRVLLVPPSDSNAKLPNESNATPSNSLDNNLNTNNINASSNPPLPIYITNNLNGQPVLVSTTYLTNFSNGMITSGNSFISQPLLQVSMMSPSEHEVTSTQETDSDFSTSLGLGETTGNTNNVSVLQNNQVDTTNHSPDMPQLISSDNNNIMFLVNSQTQQNSNDGINIRTNRLSPSTTTEVSDETQSQIFSMKSNTTKEAKKILHNSTKLKHRNPFITRTMGENCKERESEQKIENKNENDHKNENDNRNEIEKVSNDIQNPISNEDKNNNNATNFGVNNISENGAKKRIKLVRPKPYTTMKPSTKENPLALTKDLEKNSIVTKKLVPILPKPEGYSKPEITSKISHEIPMESKQSVKRNLSAMDFEECSKMENEKKKKFEQKKNENCKNFEKFENSDKSEKSDISEKSVEQEIQILTTEILMDEEKGKSPANIKETEKNIKSKTENKSLEEKTLKENSQIKENLNENKSHGKISKKVPKQNTLDTNTDKKDIQRKSSKREKDKDNKINGKVKKDKKLSNGNKIIAEEKKDNDNEKNTKDSIADYKMKINEDEKNLNKNENEKLENLKKSHLKNNESKKETKEIQIKDKSKKLEEKELPHEEKNKEPRKLSSKRNIKLTTKYYESELNLSKEIKTSSMELNNNVIKKQKIENPLEEKSKLDKMEDSKESKVLNKNSNKSKKNIDPLDITSQVKEIFKCHKHYSKNFPKNSEEKKLNEIKILNNEKEKNESKIRKRNRNKEINLKKSKMKELMSKTITAVKMIPISEYNEKNANKSSKDKKILDNNEKITTKEIIGVKVIKVNDEINEKLKTPKSHTTTTATTTESQIVNNNIINPSHLKASSSKHISENSIKRSGTESPSLSIIEDVNTNSTSSTIAASVHTRKKHKGSM